MPFPPKIPLTRVLPNVPLVARNPIKYFSRYLADYGADFILAIGGSRRTHFTVNAEVIQHVLQRNHRNYYKSEIQTRDLARYLGYGLHHNLTYWNEPEVFRPERMTPEAKKARHPSCYLPFGAGPRLCIGNNFAMLEMQLILVRLLRDYDFVFPKDAAPVGKKALITLRMDREVRVGLRKR